MRRWTVSLGMAGALVACLAIGVAESAPAATLEFTGTLGLHISSSPTFPVLTIPGGGSAQVTNDGSFHLLSFALPGGTFGPITAALPVTSSASINSLRFTGVENLGASFTAVSGGPSGGGAMGLQGLAKICVGFGPPGTCNGVVVPLTPAAGAGFGIGGTRTAAGSVNVTLENAPWIIAQPTMTIHTVGSTIAIPVLPGGFAHGPASLTSSTAQPSGALQLVTVSKVFTSLTSAFPEMPVTGVLTLHFVPEPGTLLLFGFGVAGLAAAGRRRSLR